MINLKRGLVLTLARYVDSVKDTDYVNKIKGIYDFSEKENMDLLRSIFSSFEDMIKKDHYKVLLKGWEKQFNKYVSKDDLDVSMLDASNAYIMLNHFDHLIKTEGEGIVQISGNFKGKSYEWFSPDKNPVIKYVVSSKNAHSVKNWNIGEFRDALSEVSDLEKLICEILEVKGEDGKRIVSDINMSQIGDIWSKLVKLLNKYVNDGTGSEHEDRLKSYISNYHNNPNEYIHLIFREIFEPGRNKNIDNDPNIDNVEKIKRK
jgi:hypothetical protein